MSVKELTEAFRSAMVEALLPELKELRKEMNERFQKVDDRFIALQKEMDDRFIALQKEMNERFHKVDEKFDKIIGILSSMKEDISALKARDKQIEWVGTITMKLFEDVRDIQKRLPAA